MLSLSLSFVIVSSGYLTTWTSGAECILYRLILITCVRPHPINHAHQPPIPIPHSLILIPNTFFFPIANDLSRSLLQFGVGCPLGRRGLEWLKIHIATLHGAKSK